MRSFLSCYHHHGLDTQGFCRGGCVASCAISGGLLGSWPANFDELLRLFHAKESLTIFHSAASAASSRLPPRDRGCLHRRTHPSYIQKLAAVMPRALAWSSQDVPRPRVHRLRGPTVHVPHRTRTRRAHSGRLPGHPRHPERWVAVHTSVGLGLTDTQATTSALLRGISRTTSSFSGRAVRVLRSNRLKQRTENSAI